MESCNEDAIQIIQQITKFDQTIEELVLLMESENVVSDIYMNTLKSANRVSEFYYPDDTSKVVLVFHTPKQQYSTIMSKEKTGLLKACYNVMHVVDIIQESFLGLSQQLGGNNVTINKEAIWALHVHNTWKNFIEDYRTLIDYIILNESSKNKRKK